MGNIPLGIGALLVDGAVKGAEVMAPSSVLLQDILGRMGALGFQDKLSRHEMTFEALKTSLLTAELLWHHCSLPLGVGIRLLKAVRDTEVDVCCLFVPLHVSFFCVSVHDSAGCVIHCWGIDDKVYMRCLIPSWSSSQSRRRTRGWAQTRCWRTSP